MITTKFNGLRTNLLELVSLQQENTNKILHYDSSNNEVSFSEIYYEDHKPEPGVEWESHMAAEANWWQSVTYGNGLFVAISNNGTNRVMTSPDGVNWTARTAESGEWKSITYGNGLFVAVADWGTYRIMISSDGINWTAISAPENIEWIGVTYGNGLFVAVSQSTSTTPVMTSPDGINWTSQTAPFYDGWSEVIWGNGLFVAVGVGIGDKVMTSPDGINWTTVSIAETSSFKDVAYGNGIFVILTSSVYTSSDGTNWVEHSIPNSSNNWKSIAYGGGIFTAVAYSGTGDRIMTSPDGINWTTRTNPEDNLWFGVTYGNGLFVAVAFDGTNRVMTSGQQLENITDSDGIIQGGLEIRGGVNSAKLYDQPNGTEDLAIATTKYVNDNASGDTELNLGKIWESQTASAVNQWIDITYGNGLFVAISNSGTNRVMTSPDGINWTTRVAAESVNWKSITYGDGLFVGIGQSGISTNRIMTSPDGINWTFRPISQNNWRSIAYGNGVFVAVSSDGTDRVSTSSDGINWISRSASVEAQWNLIGWGDSQFVAIDGSTAMTSPDGINWTTRSTAADIAWDSITYGNGLFVTVAYSDSTGITNRVMTSPDGITWTLRPAAEDNQWSCVTYGNGLFVAVATTGTNRVMTSPDGINWTARAASYDTNWYGVAYGNGLFVAVANSGTYQVMTSGQQLKNIADSDNIVQGGLEIRGEVNSAKLSNQPDGTEDLALATTKYVDDKNFYHQVSVYGTVPTHTPTGNYKENEYYSIALTTDATFEAPSGTPLNGNTLLIRIKDNGTAISLTWNSIYRTVGVTIPTSTRIGKVLYIGCLYNSQDSKWDVVSVVEQD